MMRHARIRSSEKARRTRSQSWPIPPRTLARGTTLGLLAGALCVPALIGVARAAQFPPGGYNSPGGYTAEVSITFTGEAAPGGGTTRTVRVAPTCWWQPAAGPYQDAQASLEWYDVVTGGLQTRGLIGEYGPRRIWKDAADAEAAGTADTSWYRAYCKNPKDYARYDAGANEEQDPVLGNPENFVTYYYRAFDAGAAVPPPLVEPEELARAAREVMVIPIPETDRNPKIQSAGAPTLVGLPTWFWVTDPEAVGGTDGDRDITATLGAVFATVTAQTKGLHLNSPAGGTNCEPSKALVKYSGGASESNACTVEFTRASVAYPKGYRVQASTNWAATWVGSGGTAGTLEGLARDFALDVPVAEVQNIVTRR
jgi:hypothetical protein